MINAIKTTMTIISINTSGSSYVSSVDTRAQSNDLDPVSVCAEAEKRSKTCAYQTESGVTTNAPLSIPGGRIITRSNQ